MGMVRSPKSISGAVGVTLGNAPYKIGDRTASHGQAISWTYLDDVARSSKKSRSLVENMKAPRPFFFWFRVEFVVEGLDLLHFFKLVSQISCFPLADKVSDSLLHLVGMGKEYLASAMRIDPLLERCTHILDVLRDGVKKL